MTDENVTGENIEHVADAPTTDENRQSITDQENSIEQSPQTVPLSALKSEREQRQQLQEELRTIKDHLSLIQANQTRPPPPKDEFDGVQDDDVITYGDAKKLLSRVQHTYQMSVQELKMSTQYPDYQEVVTKYLPEVLKSNPSIRNTLEKTQDFSLAYHLAKNSDQYRSDHKKIKKSLDAQRIVENSQQAGSLSSMGSTTPISQAKSYKKMSDDEFRKIMNKNMGIA